MLKIIGTITINDGEGSELCVVGWGTKHVAMYWQGKKSGREGGEFNADKFAKMILKYYDDNF